MNHCGGNVHNHNILVVTSSNSWNPSVSGKNVVVLHDDSRHFDSVDFTREEEIPHAPNNWICYEFKTATVIPTHYTIRFFYKCNDWMQSYRLNSWALEVSMDGVVWAEINHKENNSKLYARDVTRMFQVAEVKRGASYGS
jgi:hypothetical protein